MKKLFLFLFIFLFSITHTFAYDLTKKDELIINKINQKIDLIYKKSPEKIEKLGEKIDKILPKLKKDTRKYVLIQKIGEHIKEITIKNQNEKKENIKNEIKSKTNDNIVKSNTKKIKFININKKKEETITLTDKEKEIANQIKEIIKKIEENIKYSNSNVDLVFTRTQLEEDLVNLLNKNVKNERLFKYLNLSKEDLINFNINYLNDQLEIARLTDRTEDYKKAKEIISQIKENYKTNMKTRKFLAKKILEIGKIIGERNTILMHPITEKDLGIKTKYYNNTGITTYSSKKYYFEKGNYIGTVSYNGDSNFIIELYGNNFKYEGLLVNEIGKLEKFKFPITIEKPGYYHFRVKYGTYPGRLDFKMSIKKIDKN